MLSCLRLDDQEEYSDDLFCLVSDYILDDSSGHREASCFMKAVFVPKVKGLTQPASRILLGTITSAVRRHTQAARDSFVLPLLEYPDLGTNDVVCVMGKIDSDVGSSQIEVLTRVIKESFTPQTQVSLLDALIGCKFNDPKGPIDSLLADVIDRKRQDLADASHPHPLQHAHVAIVHAVLLLKPPIPPASLSKLVSILAELVRREKDSSSLVMLESIKFSNLILAIVSKYGSELNASIDLLDEVMLAEDEGRRDNEHADCRLALYQLEEADKEHDLSDQAQVNDCFDLPTDFFWFERTGLF
eukprot:766684-Hanusia_phi.AAC.6